MSTANYRQIRDLLATREPFNGHSMYAVKGGGQHMTGHLAGEDRERFHGDAARGIVYLVVSYSTPIAWVCADGDVYHVRQKFSVTTSRQQGLARAYLRPDDKS